jgi:hypothetical protein
VMTDSFISNYNSKHSVNISRAINQKYFFYATEVTGTILYVNTFVERNPNGTTNTLSFHTTPAGGYAKLNGINLSYLPSNKDAPSKPYGTFYPVSYSFNNFNQLQVGCPWTGSNNTTDGGVLKIKNPVYAPLVQKPGDRRQILMQVAKNIHESFPYGKVAYGKDRIESIRALSDAYLYGSSTLKYNQIKSSLQTSSSLLSGDRGAGYATMSLAYWLATVKYPQLTNDSLRITLDSTIKSAASYWSNPANERPYNTFISHSGGDNNSYIGTFLTVAGTMYGNTDWDAKGKCYMYNAATKYYSENTSSCDEVKSQYGTTSTKNIFHGNEVSSGQDGYSQYNDAVNNYINNIGSLRNGRLDNHNYGPNPFYVYAGVLTELEKATIALGSWKDRSFSGSIGHAIDNLWSTNLYTVDFGRNLWNSGQITKISPKSGLDNDGNPYWDPRYAGLTHTYNLNMYRDYSKTDNFLDPAGSVSGLLMGAMDKNNYSGFDSLLTYVWYVADDYGSIPFGQQDGSGGWTKNLHPLYYYETNNSTNGNSNEYRFLLFPSTSLERYVLAAMLLDTNLNLCPSSYFSCLNQVPAPTNTPTPTNTPMPTNTPTKTPTPTTIPEPVPVGSHGATDCNSATGWACDNSKSEQPIDVHFYRDGPAGGGGTYIGKITANLEGEAAIGTYCGGTTSHRFSFKLPQSVKDGDKHDIYAHAIGIDSSGNTNGVNPLINNTPKSITCALPTDTPTPTNTPTNTNTPTPTPIPGDLNGNGSVDINDYNLLTKNFGSSTCGNLADITGDCKVNVFDYNILLTNFGK